MESHRNQLAVIPNTGKSVPKITPTKSKEDYASELSSIAGSNYVPMIVQVIFMLNPKINKHENNMNREEESSQENTSIISQKIYQWIKHKLNPINIPLG